MKRFIYIFLMLAVSTVFSCKKPQENGGDTALDVSGITLPSSFEGKVGDRMSIGAPAGKVKLTDVLTFKAVSGQLSFDAPVVKLEAKDFLFNIPDGMVSGRYICHLKRGEDSRSLGVTTFTIISDVEVDPEDGTVYGLVTCGGKGVKDVVVSDGVEVTQTDADGIYRIKSAKKYGWVFISIPSGYEAVTNGILPKFHQPLTQEADVPERADFSLIKVQNDNHTMLVMGDIHLANRNNDRVEFRKFTGDVAAYLAAHPGEKIYGLTLGDMTWDAYWYSKNYYFPEYLNDMNASLSSLPIFHTIGNHDHDMKASGDLLTVVKYVKDIAPTYYSFNIGKIHYVVLDDIQCTNTSGGTADDRHYNETVTNNQYDWLRKDLSYVDKSTPIVVTMHAPIYRDNSSSTGLTPYAGLSGYSTLVNCFSGFSKVHFLTGHTHRCLNVEKSTYMEHNAGAVCASWWWSQKLTGQDVCTDGSPGGYTIWKVNGKDFDWVYKGTKEDETYQFRTYDLNNVCFDASALDTWVPKGSEWARNRFMELYGGRFKKNSNNEVLLNVWNYDTSWTVKAVEKLSSGDKELTVTQVQTYDPLHIIALSAPRYNSASVTSDPGFISNLTTHMFKVKASSANSTIEFTVTDRFGRQYKEMMTRPRAFNLSNYATGYSK